MLDLSLGVEDDCLKMTVNFFSVNKGSNKALFSPTIFSKGECTLSFQSNEADREQRLGNAVALPF